MKYPSAPGATYNGKFDNGVPGVRAASLDDANYMNAVYDEILNVITAGGLVPDEANLTQLLQAIQKLGPQFSDQQGSLAANGYISIPVMVAGIKRNVIIQWGLSATTTTSTPITFPVAFPNACLHMNEHDIGGSAYPVVRTFWQFANVTKNGATAINTGGISQASAGAAPTLSASTSAACPYFAIGY